MTENAVVMKNVTACYQTLSKHKVQALDTVTLEIPRQSWIAITGPSGSGKSTLLHIIGGMLRPQSGEVYVDGLTLTSQKQQDLSSFRLAHIGFIFQSFYLMPHLRAWENAAIPLIAAKYSRQDRKNRALTVLKEVGLQDRINHRPSELSGGEQQRVALARAVALKPSIILADEPTGNLDAESAAVVLDLLVKFVENGATVISATHDPSVAKRAQSIIHLQHGKIISKDPDNESSAKL